MCFQASPEVPTDSARGENCKKRALPCRPCTVLQAGKEIATQQTDKDGKFSFESLKAGNYEIRVRAETLGDAYSQIVLTRPQSKSKRELAVQHAPRLMFEYFVGQLQTVRD